LKTTAKEVAQWMKQQIEEFGELCQKDAADQIETQFGTEFVYQNENGSTAIDREVLKEF